LAPLPTILSPFSKRLSRSVLCVLNLSLF